MRLRCIAFSKLGIWPVSRIDGADLQRIPVYCISLVGSVRRRELMASQVRGLGLERFEFVDAIDASELDRTELSRQGVIDDTRSVEVHGRPLTMFEIALSLTHLRVYERMVENGDDHALILEDDALMISRRMRRFRLAEVPPDFECIFLNTHLDSEPPADPLGARVYRDTSYVGSSAAYILSASAARKLLKHGRPVIHASDGLLGRALPALDRPPSPDDFRQQGVAFELRAYLVYPHCALNGSSEAYHLSEIQPT